MWKLKNLFKKFKILKEKSPPEKNREENEYWYMENGRTVFTEKYLLERGYCCENGCRHCPYGYRKPPVQRS